MNEVYKNMVSLTPSKAKIHPSIYTTSFNEQLLCARKNTGEKKYEKIVFALEEVRPAEIKSTSIHSANIKKKITPIIVTVSQSNPLEKVLPYRFEN